jgi:chromosome segregation ATPase
MATKTIALATVPERVSVLETKVDNVESKLDDLKSDVKEMHECLDRTRDGIMEQLKVMHESNVTQHSELAGKIKELEQFKTKWVYLSAGALAALGWITAHSETILGLLAK